MIIYTVVRAYNNKTIYCIFERKHVMTIVKTENKLNYRIYMSRQDLNPKYKVKLILNHSNSVINLAHQCGRLTTDFTKQVVELS